MKCVKGIITFIFVLQIMLPLRLWAHPHGWISVKTELFIDEAGQLTELRGYWEFDTYYSTATVAEVLEESDELQTGLDRIAGDMVANLKSYHYFSELEIENRPIALAKPSDYSLKAFKKRGQQHLTLYMRFELAEPMHIEQSTLLLSVYDPTYYIDMSHADVSDVIINSQSNTECSTQIELPKPSYEVIDYASSLDVTEKSTQGLGVKFAEKVIIKCP